MAPAKVHRHHTEWVRGHLRGRAGINFFAPNKQTTELTYTLLQGIHLKTINIDGNMRRAKTER